MEKMVVKQGKIKEIDLINKYASPAVKESYIKNGYGSFLVARLD